MKTLEAKIKENISLIDKKIKKIEETAPKMSKNKVGYNKSWDKGWGNYGKTFKPNEIIMKDQDE